VFESRKRHHAEKQCKYNHLDEILVWEIRPTFPSLVPDRRITGEFQERLSAASYAFILNPFLGPRIFVAPVADGDTGQFRTRSVQARVPGTAYGTKSPHAQLPTVIWFIVSTTRAMSPEHGPGGVCSTVTNALLSFERPLQGPCIWLT